MIVLAHGAQGPFDEVILVVPAAVILVLAVAAVRRHNGRARHDKEPADR